MRPNFTAVWETLAQKFLVDTGELFELNLLNTTVFIHVHHLEAIFQFPDGHFTVTVAVPHIE